MWIALIIALIVGALGGYFTRYGTEPTKTVTKAVTNTVTKTVPPPAYTTSGNVKAQVTFDGTTCTYSGPTELNAGNAVHVKYTSTVRHSGWFVLWMSPGTTYEQVIGGPSTWKGALGKARGGLGARDSNWFGGPRYHGLSPALTEGVKPIGCVRPFRSDGKVFYATMLRVVPR